MSIPSIPLTKGIHVCHLFYRVDRARWNVAMAGVLADVDASAAHFTLRA